MFCRADFARLAEVLGGIKGRFIMSLNDVEGVRETFGRFHIAPIKTTYTIAAKSEARGERGEVLIANYDLSDKYDPSP
nr:hypothetical protein [Profundibacter amoris]